MVLDLPILARRDKYIKEPKDGLGFPNQGNVPSQEIDRNFRNGSLLE
jgi:hypothetical protein